MQRIPCSSSLRRAARISTLTLLLLLLCGSVSVGGVRVGGSGGAEVGYWEIRTTCGATGSRQRDYTEVPQAEAHVEYEVPNAPGFRIGGGGGFRLVESFHQAQALTAVDGEWDITADTTTRLRSRLFWGGVRLGYRDHIIDADGMFGFAVRESTAAPDLASQAALLAAPRWHPVGQLRFAIGAQGRVAYQAHVRVWGDLNPASLGVTHSIRFLGASLPAFWVGADFGAATGAPAMAAALGFSSPPQWRVQPSIDARFGGLRTWAVTAGVDVLIGEPGPRARPRRAPDDKFDDIDDIDDIDDP